MRVLALLSDSRKNPQAHGSTVVALHPEVYQGIVFSQRNGINVDRLLASWPRRR